MSNSSRGIVAMNGPGSNAQHTEQIQIEIRRFESVHPHIYMMYDLIENFPDDLADLRDQIRIQIVGIEDAFVNSQEWTMSRSISELRLGIVGTQNSGKTALINRYLTGLFSAEESPEGGRFKKEVVIEGQSHLLLIRDEGNASPDQQFTNWVDGLIFVYSVDNSESFEKIRHFYSQMGKYRLMTDMPILLVGTKDNLSDKNPRRISEEEGKQMATNSLKRSAYLETCAVYGLNVERVFKDACYKIIQQRIRCSFGSSSSARTPTPTTPSASGSDSRKDYQDQRYMSNGLYGANSKNNYHQRSISSVPLDGNLHLTSNRKNHIINQRESMAISSHRGGERSMSAFVIPSTSATPHISNRSSQLEYRRVSPSNSQRSMTSNGLHSRSSTALIDGGIEQQENHLSAAASTSHLPTPSSTPTTQRKTRRISNIFQRPKDHGEEKTRAIEALNHGVGRAIPIKQGHLYKKSTKSALNREWKKKYVCLYSDGRLTYHHTLKDYMDKNSHGKEVFLGLATVKVAGRQRPRNTQRIGMTASQTEEGAVSTTSLHQYETRKSDAGQGGSGEGTSGGGSDDAKEPQSLTPQNATNKKRRTGHRRIGSSGKQDEDEECFEIVTCDQKRWEFCATSAEERDDWVDVIEEHIEKALQSQLSQPSSRAQANKEEVQALRQLNGNNKCADCGQINPIWASLNIGTLICIECSGIHRNLGSHISRVRSLDLDDWPIEYLSVMMSIGNEAANKLWEYNGPKDKKPTADSPREAKESWIRSKYEAKRFLPVHRVNETVSTQLVTSIMARDVATVCLVLARATADDVNAPISSKDKRTPLHIACSTGYIEMLQLLLWNNADIRALDERGYSALWHAKMSGFSDCAEVLLTAGLTPDYGMTSTQNNVFPVSEFAVMGSLSSRDYSLTEDRDVIMRRPPPTKRVGPNFDLLPASII